MTYSYDDAPGIRRVRAGRGFRYVHPNGRPVREKRTLGRIRRLAVPPGYRDVWIATDPSGHIQATGRDSRGRKQYRYHARWRSVRDEVKFSRMLDFARNLPAIRRRVARDLSGGGLPRRKVLALVVRLLEATSARIGNEEYLAQNRSYGLTTLEDRHVRGGIDRLVLEFRGKRGKEQRCEIHDRRLARIVLRCQAVPGQRLFQYLDGEGERVAIGSADVNEYLRAASGEEFSAKDFRTWAATLLAASLLCREPWARSARGRRSQIARAIEGAAQRLQNAPAACRKYYVHPSILVAFEEGALPAALGSAAGKRRTGLSPQERSLVAFLKADERRAGAGRRDGAAVRRHGERRPRAQGSKTQRKPR